jgi:hypothetical protein
VSIKDVKRPGRLLTGRKNTLFVVDVKRRWRNEMVLIKGMVYWFMDTLYVCVDDKSRIRNLSDFLENNVGNPANDDYIYVPIGLVNKDIMKLIDTEAKETGSKEEDE